MFHVAILEEVAVGQQSDRLQEAAMPRLLKEARLNKATGTARYLQSIHDFMSRLRLNSKGRMTANEVGLLAQEC